MNQMNLQIFLILFLIIIMVYFQEFPCMLRCFPPPRENTKVEGQWLRHLWRICIPKFLEARHHILRTQDVKQCTHDQQSLCICCWKNETIVIQGFPTRHFIWSSNIFAFPPAFLSFFFVAFFRLFLPFSLFEKPPFFVHTLCQALGIRLGVVI